MAAKPKRARAKEPYSLSAEEALEHPPEPELLPDEEQAALLLFRRERGATSVSRLARAAELPVALVEDLLCRAIATLVARGYSHEFLCMNFTLTPEQLDRAAITPPFGSQFEPRRLFWPPEARPTTSPAAVAVEPAPLDEAALVAELQELLHAERRDPAHARLAQLQDAAQ
jgi:hypothetical protein